MAKKPTAKACADLAIDHFHIKNAFAGDLNLHGGICQIIFELKDKFPQVINRQMPDVQQDDRLSIAFINKHADLLPGQGCNQFDIVLGADTWFRSEVADQGIN